MNQEYIKVVAAGDLTKIRSYITSSIMADPTFATKEATQYVEYALSKGIALFESYAKTPCETPVPESEDLWDQRLFYDKIEDLRLNFAYKERIGQIRKIGQKVYRDDSFTEAPEDHRSEEKNKVVPLIAGIAVLAILVVVLITLLR